MPTLVELNQTMATKRGELAALFAEHKTDQKDTNGNPIFKGTIPLDEVNRRNDELSVLIEQVSATQMVERSYRENEESLKALNAGTRMFDFGGGEGGNAIKTMAEAPTLFTGSDAYKNRRAGQGFAIDLPISMNPHKATKAVVTESAGYLPYPAQQPYVIYSPQRKPVVADLIPQDDTNAAFIIYMEETSFVNNAAAVAEGALKPESAIADTRRTVPMTKIATTLPVTDEQLSDVPQFEAILRNRLMFMVMLEEDRELLSGNPGGSNPSEMTGFLNKTGINVQPLGNDDRFTACYKAITLVNRTTGFAQASGFVFHPNDWLTLRTTKDTLGRFILGNPDQPGPEMLWGLPVVTTIAEPQGTILTGDFQHFSHINRKWGLRVDVGYVNDDFKKNQVTLRAEERLTLEIYRALAFSLISGV